MILLDIKQYLAEHKAANLQQLACQFKQTPEVMRDMLQHWIRKGKVRMTPKPNVCGSLCNQCQPAVTEIYCWHG